MSLGTYVFSQVVSLLKPYCTSFVAIITFVPVAFVKHTLEIPCHKYQILQKLNLMLLNKTQLNQLLNDPNLQNRFNLEYNQLELF